MNPRLYNGAKHEVDFLEDEVRVITPIPKGWKTFCLFTNAHNLEAGQFLRANNRAKETIVTA